MKVLAPTEENLVLAAEAVRDGKLVVIPTETVYGLAANGLNPEAVNRIFAAKGRPADNPLILHVAHREEAKSLTTHWSEVAETLAIALWPGPLTLVVPKAAHIPSETTAGLDSVAVRCPSHPVTLRLIQLAGVPLAAPSANRFMATSPTRVAHLDPAILDAVEYVLDGGPCDVGLESTVLSLVSNPPTVLRLGMADAEAIELILGGAPERGSDRRSPGMHARHYAPKAQLVLVDRADEGVAALVLRPSSSPFHLQMPGDERAYAARIYHELHLIDRQGVETVQIERPPREWSAVWDRLNRALSPP